MVVEYDKGLYTSRIAARIARIRYQNFQAWAKANLLRPPYEIPKGKKAEHIYTYYDLLLIRLIRRLREKGFRTTKIKKALDVIRIMQGGDTYAWTRATIAIYGDLIVAILPEKPEWNPIAASKGPQKMEVVFFPELIEELKKELLPDRFKYIEINPTILGGTPVIKGTRIATSVVYNLIKGKMDVAEAYPQLTLEQVKEAESYEEFLEAS